MKALKSNTSSMNYRYKVHIYEGLHEGWDDRKAFLFKLHAPSSKQSIDVVIRVANLHETNVRTPPERSSSQPRETRTETRTRSYCHL